MKKLHSQFLRMYCTCFFWWCLRPVDLNATGFFLAHVLKLAFFSMIFVKLSHTQVMVFNENQYRSGALAIFGASSFLVAYFLDSYGATPKNVDQRTLLRTHRSRCDLRFPSFREIFLMGHQMEHFSTWNMSHSDAFAVWSSDERSFPTNSFWCLGDYPCATEASHALQSLFCMDGRVELST